MKLYTPIKIFVLVALCGQFFCMGYLRGSRQEPITDCYTIPTLAEIQTMIGVEPDGIYGPETKKAWNRALCNQAAAIHEYGFYED